ncbi:MAG: biopolymer transporter ExbD [Planctomycetota bacterium]|nr:biopolymer transporter ExbD [Planctomycetota bacterium]
MSYLQEIIDDECELQMTPMIDVVFLLLIFFLCTIKFKTLEGKLAAYLPKDVGVNTSEAEPKEKVEIKLTVKLPGTKMSVRNPRLEWDGDGRFEYSGRVVQYQIGPKRTEDLGVLQDRLKELFRADDERGATIDSRKGTVYGDVVRVLDAAILAGYTDITFVGEYK